MSDEMRLSLIKVWLDGLFLSVVAIISLYGQALVNVERLLPALNVVATNLKMTFVIAGATIMAAGASVPVLFTSMLAVFITNSSLGLGTILGSAVFNQLVVCAGVVFASTSESLILDRAVVTREFCFSAISVCLLWYVVQDVAPVNNNNNDNSDEEYHLFISFVDACLLLIGYVIYVVVCANFEPIVKLLSCNAVPGDEDDRAIMAINSHCDAPFINVGISDPVANLIASSPLARMDDGQLASGSEQDGLLAAAASNGSGTFDSRTSKMFTSEEDTSFLLWQRSSFYDNCKVASHEWNVRRFSLAHRNNTSAHDDANEPRYRITYPDFEHFEVDEARRVIKIIPCHSIFPCYYLMAPDHDVFKAVVTRLKDLVSNRINSRYGCELPDTGPVTVLVSDDLNDYGSLLDFPHNPSKLDIALHLVLYPVKALVHLTIPDVRVLDRQGKVSAKFGMTSFVLIMSTVWLAVTSYAIVVSLERLADLLQISPFVVGLTWSTVGLSVPTYISSKVAAGKGFGNKAVVNACGLNTFNILLGLGLPWAFYTSIGTHFEPYSVLRSDGVLESLSFLSITLLIFIASILTSGFKLCKWHAVLYIFIYMAFLISSIGRAFI